MGIGKVGLVIALLGVLILVALIGFEINKQLQNNAWIDVKRVYNEFEFKKELEKKLKLTEEGKKKLLDSLELDLNLMIRQFQNVKITDTDNKKFEIKRQEYLLKKEHYEQENTELQKNYNEQILAQINQYVNDYCKGEDYDFVFGADGNGSLMYASEKKDITSEIIEFINKKYKGVIK